MNQIVKVPIDIYIKYEIGRLKLNSNYLLEKFIFILLSFSMDEVVLLNMKYLNANSFVRLHLMGLLHGFTSKRFSKR